MKILLVLNQFLPQHIAGTEVYTLLLAKYLQMHGYEVLVVIPNYASSQTKFYKHEGIPVCCYSEPSIVDRELIMGFRKPDGLTNFEKVLSDFNPDIVHFQELAGSNGITLHHVESAKRLGFRIVFTFHLVKYSCKAGNLMLNNKALCDGRIDTYRCTECNYNVKEVNESKKKFLLPTAYALYKSGINLSNTGSSLGTALGFPFLVEKHKTELKRLSQTCDRIVTLTTWYSKILEINEVPSGKLTCIPQVLPHLFNECTNAYPEVSYPVKLIFIGRISHFKGIHLLIEALKGLPEDKIMLDIYGQETDDVYLRSCRESSKNMENVRWGGKLNSTEVISHMQHYHALCLPSTINEMSPLVIQEAFAAGIPVIASNVYGNAEQVEHKKNGLLFNFNSVQSLQEQLLVVLQNPSLLTEMAANIKLPSTFDTAGVEYLKLYVELLKKQ